MTNLSLIKSKMLTPEALHRPLARLRFLGKKIVFTNGCFDILHKGHIDYLSKAADYGDVLIVGINSDNSVQKLKGDGRPVQDQKSRAQILAALRMVDYVVIFDEVDPFNLIEMIKPDFLVKGSDYKPEDIVGNDIVKASGGEVIVIDFLKGYSTSTLINKLKHL